MIRTTQTEPTMEDSEKLSAVFCKENFWQTKSVLSAYLLLIENFVYSSYVVKGIDIDNVADDLFVLCLIDTNSIENTFSSIRHDISHYQAADCLMKLLNQLLPKLKNNNIFVDSLAKSAISKKQAGEIINLIEYYIAVRTIDFAEGIEINKLQFANEIKTICKTCHKTINEFKLKNLGLRSYDTLRLDQLGSLVRHILSHPKTA